jgi:6,7-dimethyl-8-ribityllumazine synthase
MNRVDVEADSLFTPKVGVVVSEFNAFVTEPLLEGALAALEAEGVTEVVVARVPGALELPVVAQKMAETCDAVVAVGAVIEGETDHYVHVSNAASMGVAHVAVRTGVPVGNAILTVRDAEHARDRSLPGRSNKGYEAAEAAVRAARVLARL